MKKFNSIRWKIIKKGKGRPCLFIPGGPGIDPQYAKDLFKHARYAGPVWGAQFLPPKSAGTNVISRWNQEINKKIEKLRCPNVVAHSAGAMLLMLNSGLPALKINSIVLLNAPTNDAYLKDLKTTTKRLSTLLKKLEIELNEAQFLRNPNRNTMNQLWQSWTPFYFSKSKIKEGRIYLSKLRVNQDVFLVGSKAFSTHKWYVRWNASKIPTLYVLGSNDNLVLSNSFNKDHLLHAKCANLSVKIVKNGGHFPWVDSPAEMKILLTKFFE